MRPRPAAGSRRMPTAASGSAAPSIAGTCSAGTGSSMPRPRSTGSTRSATCSRSIPRAAWSRIPFPSGTGGVTEDRYEVILNHNRTLAQGLSLQIGVGGEYSKLVQTGAGRPGAHVLAPEGLGDAGVDADAGPRPVAQACPHRRPAVVRRFPRQREPGPEHRQRRQRRAGAAAGLGGRLRGQEEPQGLGLGHAAPLWPLDRRLHRHHPGRRAANCAATSTSGATLYGASLTATINLDPLGWKGAKINANGRIENRASPTR